MLRSFLFNRQHTDPTPRPRDFSGNLTMPCLFTVFSLVPYLVHALTHFPILKIVFPCPCPVNNFGLLLQELPRPSG